nr:glycosyltransferase [Candidatus Aenigmarchaeota archaeon]
PIAKVLERFRVVQVVGFLNGEVFEPYRNEFDYIKVRSYRELLKVTGNTVIYAFKPLVKSFGWSLIKKLMSGNRVVLDIEDWEFGMCWENRDLNFIQSWIMEKFIRFADEVTVVSSFLQKKFGGVILPHGCNTDVFDPELYEKPDNEEKIVMFAGTPRGHKGLDDLKESLKEVKNARLEIVKGKPHSSMPETLSCADLVVLPQRECLATEAQVPGKIFEAMSMAKPIIASNVSDLPEILEGCGLIFEAGNINQLAEKIRYLVENEKAVKSLGRKARKKCIKHYSWDAMEKILASVFNSYK